MVHGQINSFYYYLTYYYLFVLNKNILLFKLILTFYFILFFGMEPVLATLFVDMVTFFNFFHLNG